jgi:hypothetical protein
LIDIAPSRLNDMTKPRSLGLAHRRPDSLPKTLRGSAERECVLEISFADGDAGQLL